MSTSQPQARFSATPFVPDSRSIKTLPVAAQKCKGRGKRRLHKRPDTAEVRAALVEDLEAARRLAGAND